MLPKFKGWWHRRYMLSEIWVDVCVAVRLAHHKQSDGQIIKISWASTIS